MNDIARTPERGIEEQRARARADNNQRAASDPGHSAWVSASAGTGKTKVLVDRVLRLLLGGAAPERILCITFTKAAAAEMANRVNAVLQRWAIASDDDLLAILKNLDGSGANADRLDRARGLFARVLESPGGLQIHTIHAFCQAVLKRFPIEAGLAPHFAVIDERDAAAARAEARLATINAAQAAPDGALARALSAIADFTAEDGFTDLIDRLTAKPEKLRAALAGGFDKFEARLYAALDLPGGATEADLIAEACAADKARDAALALAAKAMVATGATTDLRQGQAIADWLAAPKRRTELYAGYLEAFFTAGGSGPRRARLMTKKAADAAPKGLAALEREAARLEAVRIRCAAARTALATAALFRLGHAVLTHYEHYKRLRAALDFGDLIERTKLLLAGERPGDGRAAWVLWKLDGGIDHVLVDEAQDTSPTQWELVRLLVDEFFAGAGAERGAAVRTLFVVGDFKQSIFSFQGAEPRAFRRMHRYFSDAARAADRSWSDVPLDVSFRSTAPILDAVDRIFAHPPAAAGVAEDGVAEHAPEANAETIRHLTARGGLAGIVEVWPTVKPQEAAEDEAWVEAPPEAALPAPAEKLADAIATRISDWISSGEELESHGRPIRAGDVMILVRRRGAFMDAMLSALKARNVAVTGADRMRLGEQLAVQDLVALGRFLLLPDDDLTLAVVLKGPLFGFDDDDHLFPLAHGRPKGVSVWQRLGELRDAKPEFRAARERLEALLARADFVPPYELFARVLEAEGGRKAMLGRLGPDALDPLDEFLELALEYQRQHPPSLEGFLHWLDQTESEVKRDFDQSGRDEVRVMTVHGAKGLQAPIVFLADTVATPPDDERILWPDDDEPKAKGRKIDSMPLFAPSRADEIPEAAARRAARNAKEMAQYRRLLYVALTRAGDRIYVCGYETSKGRSAECWYSLIEAALAGQPTVPLHFDEHWSGPGWKFVGHGRPEKPSEPPIVARDAAFALEPWMQAPPTPEMPPFKPLAPSRPEGEEPPVRSPLSAEDGARFRRGRLIHRLLQTLPDLAPDARAAAAKRFLGRRGLGIAPAEAEAIAAETLALFEHPASAALFAPGSLAEVPLTGVVGKTILSGQVDRLAILPGEIRVIDYKTNRAPPRDAAATPPLYVKQMAAYRALLAAIYPGRAVRCFLLWTDGPIIAELSAAQLDSHAADFQR